MVGRADARLQSAMAVRSLTLHDGLNAGSLSTAFPQDCRVVLLRFDEPRVREAALLLYELTVNHGAMLGLIISQESDRASANNVLESIPDLYRGPMEASVDPRVLDGTTPDALAQSCAAHSPGDAPDLTLTVDLQAGLTLSIAESTLVRRALKGYKRVELSVLTGGHTESRLFKAHAVGQDDRACAPYVLKIGDRQDINRELDQIRDYVLESVPFPNHPPIREASCAAGASKRILVSRLVDGALRFDSYLGQASSHKEIEQCIDLIFQGPLRIWRGQASQEPRQLGEWYVKQGVISEDPAKILTPANLAIAADASIGDPDSLIARVKAYPEMIVSVSLAHGDLHARNIFARRHPVTGVLIDVVLIDFFHTRKQSPASRDLATLQVSIGLDEFAGVPHLSHDDLAQLFTGAVLDLTGLPGNRRSTAIAAIRKQAREDNIQATEYKISLIAYLLRFARFPNPPEHRKVAAYGLAWKLSEEVASALGA
jgi:hypothetical protein